MSPRAACRLETFQFSQVYDYELGIADWKAAGLPVEGMNTAAQRISDATRTDIPSSTPDETIGTARVRTVDAGWDECVVLDCGRVVVGRLRNKAWEADDESIIEGVMEAGPTTVRSDGLLEPLLKRMRKRDTKLVLVTTPQGELVGAVIKQEAQRLLAGEPPEQIWRDCDGCPGRWVAD